MGNETIYWDGLMAKTPVSALPFQQPLIPPSKNNLVILIILGIKKEHFKKTQFTAHFVHNFIHLVTVSDDNV